MRSADSRALDIGVGAMLAKAGRGAPKGFARHEILGRLRDGPKEKREVGAPRQLFAAALARQNMRRGRRPPETFRAAALPCLRKTAAKRAADRTPPARRPVDAAA